MAELHQRPSAAAFAPCGRFEAWLLLVPAVLLACQSDLWTGTQAQWDSYQTADTHPDGGDNGQRLAALNGTFGATCMQVRVKPDGMSAEDFLTQEGWYALVDTWKATHVAGGLN
jgi:hypothetical protein